MLEKSRLDSRRSDEVGQRSLSDNLRLLLCSRTWLLFRRTKVQLSRSVLADGNGRVALEAAPVRNGRNTLNPGECRTRRRPTAETPGPGSTEKNRAGTSKTRVLTCVQRSAGPDDSRGGVAVQHYFDAIAWEYLCTRSAAEFGELIDAIGEEATRAFDVDKESVADRGRHWLDEARDACIEWHCRRKRFR